MIEKPTTFIVGAGASAAYGLPTGGTLLDKARRIQPGDPVYALLHNCGTPVETVNEFTTDITRHPALSIDAYLESRQEEKFASRMRIGRQVIAILMANAIKQLAVPVRDRGATHDDWLGYIFERMREDAATWEQFQRGNADVRFVTFNFDTTIEDHFRAKLQAIYQGTAIPKDAVSVVHVHGALPTPPAQYLNVAIRGGVPGEWLTWVPMAADQIRVVLDQIDDDVLAEVRDAIIRARVICFLGFGYARENLKKLGIPDAVVNTRPAIFGSAFDLRPGEQARVMGMIGQELKLGPEDVKCLDTLRLFHVFR